MFVFHSLLRIFIKIYTDFPSIFDLLSDFTAYLYTDFFFYHCNVIKIELFSLNISSPSSKSLLSYSL